MSKINIYAALASVISDPSVKEIIEWLRARKSAFIGFFEMESLKKGINEKYGEYAFEKAVGNLVRNEALIIGSFDDYRHEHHIVLSPEAIEIL